VQPFRNGLLQPLHQATSPGRQVAQVLGRERARAARDRRYQGSKFACAAPRRAADGEAVLRDRGDQRPVMGRSPSNC